MANNYIKFSEAPEATDAQMTDAGLVGVSIVDANSSTGFSTRKSPLSKLANYVINKFNSLSLGGVTQTVKAAIDSILTLLGNSAMGTTATTITGAIAEHESDISSLNSSFVETHASFSHANFYNSATAVITKVGKVVILTVPALTGLTANAQTDLGEIIPAGFRPSGLVQADCVDGNSSFRVVRITVNESGKMLIYNYSSTTGLINISGRIVYFTS